MYFVEKSDGFKYFKSFDYIIFFSVVLLSVFGLIVLASAVQDFGNPRFEIIKQMISIIIGIIFALSISIFDYRDIKNVGFILYGISIALLITVFFIGIGKNETGTQGWLDLGIITFQPSEIAKISTILVLAKVIEDIKEHKGKLNILKVGVLSLIPIGFIFIQPDFGTTMAFIFFILFMLYIAGIKYRYIFFSATLLLVAIPMLWSRLEAFQKNRILTLLNPELDPLGKGYQVIRARIAIGSGRLFGQGLFSGIQNNSNGIPVKESDFIYAVIGEELGFIGSVGLIVLFGFIIIRAIYVSYKAKDHFGTLVAAGIAGMWAFHFIENVGMNLGLMPVTGIPLPFISLGGSAMITNFIAMGILVNISMRNHR